MMKQLFIENFVIGFMSCFFGYFLSYTDYKLPEEFEGIYILFIICIILICLFYRKSTKPKKYNLKLLHAASYGVLKILYILFPLFLLLISWIKSKTGEYLLLNYSMVCYFIGLTLILRFIVCIYLQKNGIRK